MYCLCKRNSRIFLSYPQVLPVLVMKHIFCKLPVVLVSLLPVCRGFSGTRLSCCSAWLQGSDSWPQPQAYGLALYLLAVGGLASLVSRGLHTSAAQDYPRNNNTELQNWEGAARMDIHVFSMYTISVYRFNTSQGRVKASGCSAVLVFFPRVVILFFFADPVSYSISQGPVFPCASTQICSVLCIDSWSVPWYQGSFIIKKWKFLWVRID